MGAAYTTVDKLHALFVDEAEVLTFSMVKTRLLCTMNANVALR